MNVKFLFFIVLVIFIFKNRQKLYQTKFNIREKYTSGNLLGINFLEKDRYIEPKKIYTHEHDTLEYIPNIYTNYKYSLEFKFGYELSKIFKIRNEETPGLFYNLKTAANNSRDIFMCSEVDYYRYLENNPNLKESLNFICSLYYQHFLLFSKVSSQINCFLDLVKYKNDENLPADMKETIIKIGIPSPDTNSYQDAVIIFKMMGINVSQKPIYKNINFIFDSEKNLMSRLKLDKDNTKSIECMYLTTSNKNIYLQEYLNTGNINVCSTSRMNQNVIKSNYGGNYLFNQRLPKNNFSQIVKKKNIYEEIPDYTISTRLINNSSETLIIGGSYLNVLSTRVILIASNKVDKDYIKYLLRNIYGNLDKLKLNLNKYLLVKQKKNFLPSCLDPYEMSYLNEKFKYHPGAYEFYQEIQIISDESNLSQNIHMEK